MERTAGVVASPERGSWPGFRDQIRWVRLEDDSADPDPLGDCLCGAGPCDSLSLRLKLFLKPLGHAFPQTLGEV